MLQDHHHQGNKTLRMVIRHIRGAGGVWFATGSQIARWRLDEIFKIDRPVAAE